MPKTKKRAFTGALALVLTLCLLAAPLGGGFTARATTEAGPEWERMADEPTGGNVMDLVEMGGTLYGSVDGNLCVFAAGAWGPRSTPICPPPATTTTWPRTARPSTPGIGSRAFGRMTAAAPERRSLPSTAETM